jgi:hypothetical protein
MQKLILTDGEVNNGGYSTLAFNLYNNMKEKGNIVFHTFIFADKPEYGINEIQIKNSNNDNDVFNILQTKFNNKHFDIIICTSPWAFYISSLFFNKLKILYIKGGGLKTDKYITTLSNIHILDAHIDDFFDQFTIQLERKSIANIKDYNILPTTDMLYEMLVKSQTYTFLKNRLLKPLNFAWSRNNLINNTNIEKEYDLIFVVSDHKRIVKNSEFTYKIFESNPKLTKIVIGMNCEHYNVLPNTTVVNKCIENNEVKQLFLKSRVLLIPSYYDSGPSTIIEALSHNCIPICYYNCGFSLLDISGCSTLDNLNLQQWCDKIEDILNNIDDINWSIMNVNINKLISNDVNSCIQLL